MRSHLSILALSLAVLGLSFALDVRGPTDVRLGGHLKLPPLCHFKRFTGFDCPGCGLTRSFVCLAHGDLTSALRFNPASPLWFAALLLQIPYRAWRLWKLRCGEPEASTVRLSKWLAYTLLGALLLQWTARLLLDS